MDWLSGPEAPVRRIEHSDGKEFGTGFAVYREAGACWLVTCAHVARVFDYQESGSRLTARAFDLRVTGGEFQKGHSGAPAICNRTGAVFAVVATREGQEGATGSAICIS